MPRRKFPVVAFNVRLPAALHRRLQRWAERERESMNRTIERAVEQYLAERERAST